MVIGEGSLGVKTLGTRAISFGVLVLLCLLMTGGVLRSALFPAHASGFRPSLGSGAVPFILLALVAGIYAVVRGEVFPRGSRLWGAVLVGLAMFVAPIGLAHAAEGAVSSFARTAFFSLVPVFAIVFEPYVGLKDASQSSRGLLAALVAVAGALCVFPIEIPGTLEAGASMCAAVVAAACVAYANCCLVAMSADLEENSTSGIAPVAAISGATAAVCLGVASAVLERTLWNWNGLGPELLWATVVDLPVLLLLFWLARRMSAARMATRYLIAPGLAILLGALALQAPLQPRTWLGLGLMAAGAGYLLLAGNTVSGDHVFSLKD